MQGLEIKRQSSAFSLKALRFPKPSIPVQVGVRSPYYKPITAGASRHLTFGHSRPEVISFMGKTWERSFPNNFTNAPSNLPKTIPQKQNITEFSFVSHGSEEGTAMRWFKHFTDNHRGRTVQRLLDEVGHGGATAYYFIIELCAEKLEKIPGRELSDNDCIFTFNQKVIQNVTRMKRKSIQNVIRIGAECGVWEAKANGNEIEIKMPILLDLLDRDLKGTRSRRAQDAQKPRPELDIELDKDNTLNDKTVVVESFDFKNIYEQYPRKSGSSVGIEKLKKKIKAQDDYDLVQKAVQNFSRYHRIKKTEPKFIPHFQTWVTRWRDSLEGEFAPVVSKVHTPSSTVQENYNEKPGHIGFEKFMREGNFKNLAEAAEAYKKKEQL